MCSDVGSIFTLNVEDTMMMYDISWTVNKAYSLGLRFIPSEVKFKLPYYILIRVLFLLNLINVTPNKLFEFLNETMRENS